jgi:hypothetical protein
MNAPTLLELEIWRGLVMAARTAIERASPEHLRTLRRRGEQAYSTRAPSRDTQDLRTCSALALAAQAFAEGRGAELAELAGQVETMLDSWKTKGASA